MHVPRPSTTRRLTIVGALVAAAIVVALVVVLSMGSEPEVARATPATQGTGTVPASPATPVRTFDGQQVVTIGWAGDTTPRSASRSLFTGVRGLLRRPDLTIGNLEGTLGSGGTSKCRPKAEHCFAFQAPAAAAGTLRWAGFDVLNLANNHAWDYGASGQAQTLAALDAAHVAHTGRPGEIVVVRRRGVRVAILGFAPYPWASRLEDLAGATALVAQARAQADVVVVAMHAGAEGADQGHTPRGVEVAYGEQRGDTRAFAHAVVDAGADLVVGSGPHVVRGVERRRGALIVYSTGNFAGEDSFATSGALGRGAMVVVALTAKGQTVGGRWHGVRLDARGTPARAERGGAADAARLSAQDFGADAALTADGVLHPRRSQAG